MKTAHDLVLAAKTQISEVSVQDAPALIREADVLVDVREPQEFASGHLPGAINSPRGLLEFQLSGTAALSSRDLHFVLYCKTSGRAALAAQSMRGMGFLHVQSIAGGYDAWIAAEQSIVKPEQPSFD